MKTKQVPKAAYFNPESSDLGNTAAWSGRGGGCDPSKPGETCSNPQKSWEPRWEPHQLRSFSLFNVALLILCRFPISPLRGTEPRAVRKAASTAWVRLSLPNKPLTSSASLSPSIFPKLPFTIQPFIVLLSLNSRSTKLCGNASINCRRSLPS